MVGSQIDNFILDLSFGHNLCFKYPNGSWEPISKIYMSRTFQWYKEIFNPMSFGFYNCPLKIEKSIKTLTPKWELTWECVGSLAHTFVHSRKHEMWFLGFTFGRHLYKLLLWLQAQGWGYDIDYIKCKFPYSNFSVDWNDTIIHILGNGLIFWASKEWSSLDKFSFLIFSP